MPEQKFYLKLKDREQYACFINGVGYWDRTPIYSYPETIAKRLKRENEKLSISLELVPAKETENAYH